MKTAEIQKLILDETGIETTVSKMTGSMKEYTRFRAKKPARFREIGSTKSYPFLSKFRHYLETTELNIHNSNITTE